MALHSVLQLTRRYWLFAAHAEDREDEDHGEDGKEHSGDGADCETRPEYFRKSTFPDRPRGFRNCCHQEV